MGGSRAASSLPGPSFSLASPRLAAPRRSYGRCASRARSAVSRGISKNQYTRTMRRDERRGREAKKKRGERKSIFDIPFAPALFSFPPLPFFPWIRLSRLSFRSSSFFLHYPPARRIARNLALSLSLVRSLIRDTTSRTATIEKGRSRPIGFEEENSSLGGSRR